MKTCKSCLHYQVCLEYATESVLVSRGTCDHYRDEALNLQLPCAMGQEIFRPHCDTWNDKINSGVYRYKVAGFQVKKNGVLKVRLADSSGSHEVTLADLESAYFMNEAKAEAALSEMKKKAEQKLASRS